MPIDFFASNAWWGSHYRYIRRFHRQWLVRIKAHQQKLVYQVFKDEDYAGPKMALRAAMRFRDQAVAEFSAEQKVSMRLGYPRPDPNAGVFMTTRQKPRGHGVYVLVVAKCHNKFLGIRVTKSFSVGEKRSREEAFALARRWRIKMIEDYQAMAIQKGMIKL